MKNKYMPSGIKHAKHLKIAPKVYNRTGYLLNLHKNTALYRVLC